MSNPAAISLSPRRGVFHWTSAAEVWRAM